jgi:GWxTD domain-containing protein
MKRDRWSVCAVALFCGLVWSVGVASQQEGESVVHETRPITTQSAAQSSELKPCFDAQDGETSNEREQVAVANVPKNYRFWLTEDASYIITPEEHCGFLHLGSEEDRDRFIEQFWYRRTSDHESLENDFQEEHYRRIVFANEKFGTDVPGWKTDRGRLYISFGPPDIIESHPKDTQEGHDSRAYPREKWHYRYIEDLGPNIDFEFLDTTGSGDYRLTTPLEERAKLVGKLPHNLPYSLGKLDRGVASEGVEHIVIYIGPLPQPQVKFKDLEAMVVSRIIRHQVYFTHRIEYIRATHASTMARIVVEIPEAQLSPPRKDGKSTTGYEIFGRITRPTGWVISTFERSGNADEHEETGPRNPNRETTVALEPAPYQLALVVKDIDSGKTGVMYTTFRVPRYGELGKQQH